ncbi:hypothetical protein ACFLZ8_02680, partial [Planctomycetota bacterium]
GYGNNKQYIPVVWLEMLHTMEIPIEDMARWEMQFQNHILSVKKSLLLSLREEIKFHFHGGLRLKKNPKALTKVPINELKTSSETLYKIRSVLQKVKQKLYRSMHAE